MLHKAFIINFDKGGGLLDTFDYKKFHDLLTNTKGIESWFHYLESSYIVVVASNVTASNISDVVRQYMPNKHLLVIELNLKDYNGWLPKEAWDWINKHNNL